MAVASLRPPRAFTSSICQACRQRLLPARTSYRAFGSNSSRAAPEDTLSETMKWPASPTRQSRGSSTNVGGEISAILDASQDTLLGTNALTSNGYDKQDLPHRLHVYATKHNTHITLVQPAKAAYLTASSGISRTSASAADQKKQIDVLLSLSAGNIGFRKAGRGSYDAAYQLGAFVCKQIQEKGMLRDIKDLQVVLRGFGAGREAVSKVLLGSEGRALRGSIKSVVDATRLKQGGPRGKKPRRLG